MMGGRKSTWRRMERCMRVGRKTPMRSWVMLISIVCAAALFAGVGCAALDEGYSTHYGLTSTDPPRARENPADESYSRGFVDIQEIEEYEEKYQKRDIMKQEGATEQPATTE